jgi:hypothetical protein
MYRVLFGLGLVVLVVSMVVAGTPQPAGNLAGTWKIDHDHSTAAPDLTTQIVVIQMGDAIRFDYYEGKRIASSEHFIVDGRSRERYKTQQGKSFGRARWQKGALLIETTTALDNEGLQSYNSTERWTVSGDGKTLTMKSGDGKVRVFTRIADAEEPGH